MAAIVEEIIAVPARTARSHLNKPWPKVLTGALDRDGMRERADRLRNPLVASKSTHAFGLRCFYTVQASRDSRSEAHQEKANAEKTAASKIVIREDTLP